jgi:hypothetical protein
MQFSHPSPTQVVSVFGSGYVAEQHQDHTHRNLPTLESHEFKLDFSEILKALRSALALFR